MLLLTKSTPKDGVKLAPPIKSLSVLSYERHADQKLWYIIKVTPQQTETIGNNSGTSSLSLNTDTSLRPTLQRKSYLIARRFEQFCGLDQQLHSDFSPSIISTLRSKRSSRQSLEHSSSLFSSSNIGINQTTNTNGDNTMDINDLPKLKLQRKILPNKNIHQERQSELHRYCQELLHLPSQVTQSLMMLEFFGLHKPDTERIVYSSLASRLSYIAPSPVEQETTIRSPTVPTSPTIVSRRTRSIVLDDDEGAYRLIKKAKSQPNFSLPPSPPPPLLPLLVAYDDLEIRYTTQSSTLSPSYSTSSTESSTSTLLTPPLSSFSAHASSPFGLPGGTIHKSQQQHGLDTRPSPLTISTDRVIGLDEIDSPTDILSLPPSAMSLSHPSSTSDFYTNYLKLKVVYDLDNIILLQVPRTIRLPELRAKILHKFEDTATDLPVDFKLVFNSLAPGGRKDSLLSSSAAYSTYANLDARTIIGTQDDLVEAMSKWIDLPKVSVRCVVN